MRTANLNYLIPLFCLGSQGTNKARQGWYKLVFNFVCSRHMDGCRKCIVGTLPHVYVIIGMDLFFRIKSIAAQQFDRAIGNHFVYIHVAGGTRTCLKHINRKLGIQISVHDLATRIQHDLTLFIADWVLTRASQFSKITICNPASMFHPAHRVNKRWWKCPT